MKRINFKQNLSSIMFSIFYFLFAIEPAIENHNIIYYSVLSLRLLCGVIWLINCTILIANNKKSFILGLASKSLFSFFDTTSALIGLIISYSFNSSLFKLWIFFFLLNIVYILIPSPKIKDDTIQNI